MTEPTVVLPADPAPRSRRRGLIAAGVAMPVVLIAAGGAFAYQQLNGGGAQPDDVLPSSVIAYARLDANPSAAQKIKLFGLIRKSPDLAKQIGIQTDKQDLRKEIVQSVLSGCNNVDYDKDIKPWIGDRIGVGITDVRSGNGIVAIQVTDEKAARKGIDLAAGCLGASNPGVAFSQGYALVGQSQKDVDAAVKGAGRKSLSSDPAFVEDMKSLGDHGVASMWLRADKLTKALTGQLNNPATLLSLDGQRSLAATLRAGDDNIELTTISHQLTAIGQQPAVDLGALPGSSVLAASIPAGGKKIDAFWQAFTGGVAPSDVESMVKGFKAQTGFSLPSDLKKLVGDKLTIVVGDRNLGTIANLTGPQDVAGLDVAIALTSNRTDATDIANRVAKAIADNIGVNLAVVGTPDGAILATNKDFASTFSTDKKLGTKDSFSSVISNRKSVSGVFFFDIAKAVSAARGIDMPASGKKLLDQLKHLKALGLSATKDSDHVTRETLKLSFN